MIYLSTKVFVNNYQNFITPNLKVVSRLHIIKASRTRVSLVLVYIGIIKKETGKRGEGESSSVFKRIERKKYGRTMGATCFFVQVEMKTTV